MKDKLIEKYEKIKARAKAQGLKTTEGIILTKKGKLKEMLRDERN